MARKLDQTFDPGHQGSMGQGDPCARAVGVTEQLRVHRAVAGGCHVKVEGRRGAQGITWDGGERKLQRAFTKLDCFGVMQHQPGVFSRANLAPADGDITTAENTACVFRRSGGCPRGGSGGRLDSHTASAVLRACSNVGLAEEGIKSTKECGPYAQLFWVAQEQVLAKLSEQ